MKDAVAIIHFNTWYIHVSRTDDDALICFKYDEISRNLEVEYFTDMIAASEWVLEPVNTIDDQPRIHFQTKATSTILI